jgi:pimeloyl-ACP methyl ester carboxylesterase
MRLGRGLARAAVGVLVVTITLAGLVLLDRRVDVGVLESWEAPAFYRSAADASPGEPGSIAKVESILSGPADARAWRVLYHSRDESDRDVVVSGVVVAPVAPAPPGGRTVVTWGHPTTGVAQRCAPSLNIDPFILIEGLQDLIRHGYVVVATDYVGMGAPGRNEYLVGTTAGRTLLDIARAGRTLTGASDRLVVWGHSQGGHAALFAGQLAPTYAPELQLEAVAVAAPATDLGALLTADIDDVSGVTIGSYAFDAYSTVYGPPLDSILTPAGAAATPGMANLCLLGQNKELHTIATPLIGRYLRADPATTEPWAGLLQQNTPGATRLTVPLFVAQGETDALVRPEVTARFVAHERSLGTTVEFDRIPDTGHGLVGLRALKTLLPWLASVGAGPVRD